MIFEEGDSPVLPLEGMIIKRGGENYYVQRLWKISSLMGAGMTVAKKNSSGFFNSPIFVSAHEYSEWGLIYINTELLEAEQKAERQAYIAAGRIHAKVEKEERERQYELRKAERDRQVQVKMFEKDPWAALVVKAASEYEDYTVSATKHSYEKILARKLPPNPAYLVKTIKPRIPSIGDRSFDPSDKESIPCTYCGLSTTPESRKRYNPELGDSPYVSFCMNHLTQEMRRHDYVLTKTWG